MIRNLKVLGLALVAVFAMSGVAASASSAAVGTLTSDGPFTLFGTNTGGEGANALTAFGGKVECPNALYTGHKYNVTPHELIPSGASTVTITPHYGSCIGLGKPATVDMNGCDYVFHIEETSGVDKYAVKSTVVCPSGKHIEVTLFENATKHTEGKKFCTLTITEKATDYTGLTATDTTNGKGDVTGTVEGIKADKKGEGVLCAEATTEVAKLDLDITVEAKNAEGGATSVSITHT